MIASLPLLRIAATLGALRSVVPADRIPVYDTAIVALSIGDLDPVLTLLSRASLGMRDCQLRADVVEAWALLDAVENEISFPPIPPPSAPSSTRAARF